MNIQSMNGLISNIVIYEKETFLEKKRYSYENSYVFTDLEIEKDVITLLGYERIENDNVYKVFTFQSGTLSSYDISKDEYHLKSKSWNKAVEKTIHDAREILGIDVNKMINE